MDFNDLTPELMEKAKACTTPAELAALAETEGIELTDEQLDAVAGGGRTWSCQDKDCDDFCSDCRNL